MINCHINKPINYSLIKNNDKKLIRLEEDFIFYMTFFGQEQAVIVPQGFISDGFSLPKLFKPLHNPLGKGVEIAVVHDFLYSKQSPSTITRAEADLFFKEGMACMGMKPWKYNLFYTAVWAFGWLRYKKRY